MGWRDREYAKWTDDERRRFYGSGATYSHLDPPVASAHTRLFRPGAGVAMIVSAVVALGQLPVGHPLLPILHIGSRSATVSPQAPVQRVGAISGPRTATYGSSLSLHGAAPAGQVTVEGSYDSGQTWQVLASVTSVNGAYDASIPLSQRGTLQIRIAFADGSSTVGSILVQ